MSSKARNTIHDQITSYLRSLVKKRRLLWMIIKRHPLVFKVSAFSGIVYPIDFYIDIRENKYVPDDCLDQINNAMMDYAIADPDEDCIDSQDNIMIV